MWQSGGAEKFLKKTCDAQGVFSKSVGKREWAKRVAEKKTYITNP